MSTDTAPPATPAQPALPIAWGDIQADPKWSTLNTVQQAHIARIYAQKVLAPAYGGGSHPAVASFLQQNLPPVKGPAPDSTLSSYLPDATPGFIQAGANDAAAQAAQVAQQGFVGTAVNQLRGAPQVEGPGFIQGLRDAAGDIATGGATINPLNPDFWHGAAGAAGGVVGAVPDAAAAIGGTLAGAATLGGGPAALAAAGALVGEGMAGSTVAMRGGTAKDILEAMPAAGLMGLAPGLDELPVVGKGGSLSDYAARQLAAGIRDIDAPQIPAPTQPDPRLALPPGRPWVDGQYQYLPTNAAEVAARAADNALPSPELAGRVPEAAMPFAPRATAAPESAYQPTTITPWEAGLPPNAAAVAGNVAADWTGAAGGFGDRLPVAPESAYQPAPPTPVEAPAQVPDLPPAAQSAIARASSDYAGESGGFGERVNAPTPSAYQPTPPRAPAPEPVIPTAPAWLQHVTDNALPSPELAGNVPETGAPFGARPGRVSPTLPQDMAAGATRAAGNASLVASNAARRVSELAFQPVHALDAAWRDTPVFQKLADFREAVKYGQQGGGLAQAMRKAFISNYGVDPKLLDIAETAAAKARAEVLPTRTSALDMAKRLNSRQQAALDYEVTEPTGAPRSPQAETIGQESGRLSTLLADVGALGKNAQERWDGFYLPRAYEDRYPLISSFVRGADRAIRGEKARGQFQEMSEQRFAELSKPWREIGQTPDGKLVTLDDGTGKQLQVARRNVGDYTGVWERRGTTPGGKVNAWRDYTLDERERMGQERHVSASMLRLADKFESKYQVGRMLADIAKDPDMALPAKDVEEGAEPRGYTLLDKTKNRDGTYKWGKLADHYVRDDVVSYLKWNQDLGQFKQFIKAGKAWTGQNLWKRFVTIHNPSYYLNNFMQNVPALELSGGSIFDLPAAAREVASNGPVYQKMRELGAVDNGRAAHDLAAEMKFLTISPGSENPLRTIGKVVDAMKTVEAKGANFSQATDDMFRVALALKHIRDGMMPEAAAKAIDGVFYDPAKVTSPAAEVAGVAAPFAKGFFYTMDAYPKLVMENPAKAATLLGLMYLGDQLAKNAAGYTTAKAKQGLDALTPNWMQSFGGIPGSIPLPMHDANGHGLLMDVHNWNPLQPVQGDDKSQLPIPGQLMPGGPLFTAAQYLANYDAFKQQPLRESSPEGQVIRDDSGEFLRNNLLPAWAGSKGGKVVDAMMGRADAAGRRYDLPTALANMAGVKVQPLDNARALDQLNNGYVKQMADLKTQGLQLARLMANNPGDASAQRALAANTAAQQQLAAEWARSVGVAAAGFPSRPAASPPPGPLSVAAPYRPPVANDNDLLRQQLLSRPGSGAGAF